MGYGEGTIIQRVLLDISLQAGPPGPVKKNHAGVCGCTFRTVEEASMPLVPFQLSAQA